MPEITPFSTKVRCHRPWTGFELYDHLGDVRPCCWGKKSCGNINNSTKEEIWKGATYELYRNKMLLGEYDEICREDCPILNGSYIENVTPISHPKINTEYIPIFLRVVPSITCDLKCPICYQLNDPPARLPEDLFNQLKPWLGNNVEFQILGGEPFLSKKCIAWIEQLDPREYPKLRLTAITNGLHFTENICKLISLRNWNWIMVSIDAASEVTYSAVRGGDFFHLLENLDRLSVLRNTSTLPFEIRFGFTIQKSNLNDVVSFLDLCDRYSAVPQFTMVSGDWHEENFRTDDDIRQLLGTLEYLDKQCFNRGYSRSLLKPLYRAIKSKIMSMKRLNISNRDYTLSQLHTSDTRLESYDAQLNSDPSAEQPLRIVIDDIFRENKERLMSKFANIPNVPFTISIPWVIADRSVSCLQYVQLGIDFLHWANRNKWHFVGGDVDLQFFELELDDIFPKGEVVFQKEVIEKPKISIISAAYNRANSIEKFLSSIGLQSEKSFELILVDDGSEDNTASIICSCLESLNFNITFIKLARSKPYEPGTFSFRAGVARQYAVDFAKGERLMFFDPDQEIQFDCLAEHMYYDNLGFEVIIGDRKEKDELYDFSGWNYLRNVPAITQSWWLSFFTGNSSVRKTTFDFVGGFDKRAQYWGLDDTDLGYRLYRSGASVIHTKRALVYHLSSDSGGGNSSEERTSSYRFHMEYLYRKYLDVNIIKDFNFAWKQGNGNGALKSRNFSCNICGWNGSEFEEFEVRKGVFEREACPNCQCINRERHIKKIIETLNDQYEFNPKIIEIGAAERFIKNMSVVFNYKCADIIANSEHLDFIIKKGRIQTIGNQFNLAILSYVLSEIKSYSERIKLLKEVFRITKLDTKLIIFDDISLELEAHLELDTNEYFHCIRLGSNIINEIENAGWNTTIKNIYSGEPAKDFQDQFYLECTKLKSYD